MKVYSRAEFLKLPEGTIYSQGKQWHFGALCVKGKTTGHNDWYELSLDWIDGEDSGECFDRLDKMLRDGASFPVQDSTCRDGMFEEDTVFLVWEKADLLYLRGLVDAAIAMEKP